MIPRLLTQHLRDSLRLFPAVALVGARQVGKTTLARAVCEDWPGQAIYLDLERPSDLAKLQEPELYLEAHRNALVVLDEAQRRPDLFPLLRTLIDADRRPGRFLLLGSASPTLTRQAAESLAGRIVTLELTPFLLAELSTEPDTVRRLWLRGGYAESYLAASEQDSYVWRESFIQTHLERDIPGLGLRLAPTALRRFWTMIAHSHGQLWNASKLASSLGLSAPTVRHYLDVLQDTFMLRQLAPWHANVRKRLVKGPKIYVRDSGLLHALLGLPHFDALAAHPVLGASWEGWAIEQILSRLPIGWSAGFYRTTAGAEIDLVLIPPGDKPLLAVEVKYSSDPRPAAGFRLACEDLDVARAFVVYPGAEAYPLGNGAMTLPAAELARVFQTSEEFLPE